jgi:hypothetical protein
MHRPAPTAPALGERTLPAMLPYPRSAMGRAITRTPNDTGNLGNAAPERYLGAPDGEELPAVGDAIEGVGAAVGEVEAGKG